MRTPKLFTPGPTAVPAEILETQARPLIHHRTEEFREALIGATRGLQYILRTEGPVPILTASGSGAMEAAVLNLTKPGDTVIVTEVGKFSERWREIGETFGMKVVSVKCEPGEIVTPAEVDKAFDQNKGATALFCTHSETSTGVLLDVKEMAKVAHAHNVRACCVAAGRGGIRHAPYSSTSNAVGVYPRLAARYPFRSGRAWSAAHQHNQRSLRSIPAIRGLV